MCYGPSTMADDTTPQVEALAPTALRSPATEPAPPDPAPSAAPAVWTRVLKAVAYGMYRERLAVIGALDWLSRQQGVELERIERGSGQGGLTSRGEDGHPRSPKVDEIIGGLLGCAHIPTDQRVMAPVGEDDAHVVVGLTAEELAHFGRVDPAEAASAATGAAAGD